MRLILKHYLASLNERPDLDKNLLPDLLSQMGLRVITTPKVGIEEYGVDITAVGKLRSDDRRYLYLFQVKRGNVTRSHWDNDKTCIRPELNAILDVYLNSFIAPEHADLPVKICLCFGGEMDAAVHKYWAQYTSSNCTPDLRFEVWNGDRLAEHMEATYLAPRKLSDAARINFQKAVALANEPDACYEYTRMLLGALFHGEVSTKGQLLRLQQAYLCIKVIEKWAADGGNLKMLPNIVELGMLYAWDEVRKIPIPKRSSKHLDRCTLVMGELILLNQQSLGAYFEKAVYPLRDKLHALSYSVGSEEPVDTNLAMFEILGRLAMYGIWAFHFLDRATTEQVGMGRAIVQHTVETIIQVVNNNPALHNPIRDDHMIEIALVMILAQRCGAVEAFKPWLLSLGTRIQRALVMDLAYPTCITDYRKLVYHPASSDPKYVEEACRGSVLYPYLFLWISAWLPEEELDGFVRTLDTKIPSCTHQAWFPDENTDDRLWRNLGKHGVCLPDVAPGFGAEQMRELLNKGIEACIPVGEISAVQSGLEPLLFAACRHHRLPIPPQYWFPTGLTISPEPKMEPSE